MKQPEIVFRVDELGAITLELQQICIPCRRSRGEAFCSLSRSCPLGMCSEVLVEYLRNRTQVQPRVDLDAYRQMPPRLTIDEAPVRQVFSIVPGLCNRCMFHFDMCFLNIVYRLLEVAVGVERLKPLSVRPGHAGGPGPEVSGVAHGERMIR